MSKKNLSRQKKFDTRIDFTPMVDMNMLLITFFMLCTTMLKSQTMKIALPTNSKDSQQKENQNQAAQSRAITIIIDGKEDGDPEKGYSSNPNNTTFYYYQGILNPADPNSLKKADGITGGNTESFLRFLLEKQNKETIKLVEVEKQKRRDHKYSANDKANDSLFNVAKNKIILEQGMKPDATAPILMIKPTGRASYADVIAILDEMSINSIGTYQLESLSKEDTLALANKGVKLPPVNAK